MNDLPCKGCRGLCCGPVPITKQELCKIRKAIKRMSYRQRLELENQQRYFGTCIFYDLDNDLCGIHAVRPSICRAFGHYNNLICFRSPDTSARENWIVTEGPIGILSVDFTWRYFE